MDEVIENEISKDDSTPSILNQARENGWNAEYYNFGKAEVGRDWFNPSIVERDDGIWLLVRGSEPHPQGFRFGQNFIWAFEMDATGKVPKRGIRLQWPVEILDQHFEDPRGFYHPGIDQTIIGACTFTWHSDGTWTGAHQCLGSFNDKWECSKMDYPKIGGSPGRLEMITDKKRYEKNWLPFLHDNQLHILYKANPWKIIGYGQTWSDFHGYEGKGVTWAHGEIRGGTSPVKVGDYYFTFPHSSLMWKGRYRRYYAGAMAFDSKPPFKPRMITPEPLLMGSQNDIWAQKKPLVIFPCGALYKNGTWLVTCGVNDMKAAWVELSHESLLKRLQPIEGVAAPIFSANGLSAAEVRKEKLRANLVKARAARAAKRGVSQATNKEDMLASGFPNGGSSPSAPISRKRRRRIKRRKDMGFNRQQALAEHETKKNLVPT